MFCPFCDSLQAGEGEKPALRRGGRGAFAGWLAAAAAAFFGGGVGRVAGRRGGGFGGAVCAGLLFFGLVLLGAQLFDHALAGAVAGEAELLPPVGQFLIDFADVGSQAQEVEAGAKARLAREAEGGGAAAALEAGLHHPDFAHVGAELAAPGNVADAGVEDFIDGRLQGGDGVFAAGQPRLPERARVLPEDAGEQKRRGDGLAFGQAPVGVLQGGLDEGLFGAFDDQIEQRVDAAGQPQFVQLLDAGEGVAGLQELEHFVEQAALRHVGQERPGLDERAGGFGFEREADARQLGGEAHGADDAHGVFAVAGGGVADHAQALFAGVLDAAVVVDHDAGFGVVVHGVDGEVAPRGVFFLRAPDVVAQHAAGGIDGVFHAGQLAAAGALVAADLLGLGAVQVGAEGGDFDDLVLAPAPEHHMDDAKAPPDDEGPPKELLDLLGRGVGGDVKVLGRQAQQQVAHRAADDVGGVARLLQRAHDVGGAFVDQRGVDAVRLRPHFHALAQPRAGAAGLADQAANQVFDHRWGLFSGSWVLNSSSTGQPRSAAAARSASSGLAATGCCTLSSSGKSLRESE